MFQIVYSSRARIAFTPTGLEKLLTGARARNTARAVTGLLVFCDGLFLQVLEGDPRDVIATFERIERDSRHGNVKTLFRDYSHAGKTFREWSMGFHHLASPADIPAGFVRVNNRIDLSQFDGLAAIEFLSACQPAGVPT
jgi:hypothetical protein